MQKDTQLLACLLAEGCDHTLTQAKTASNLLLLSFQNADLQTSLAGRMSTGQQTHSYSNLLLLVWDWRSKDELMNNY